LVFINIKGLICRTTRTGSVIAQVLLPLWRVVSWVFIDANLDFIISSSNRRAVLGGQSFRCHHEQNAYIHNSSFSMREPICPLRRTYEIPRKKGQIILGKASAVAKAMADKKG
jgi:hypothetical protein